MRRSPICFWPRHAPYELLRRTEPRTDLTEAVRRTFEEMSKEFHAECADLGFFNRGKPGGGGGQGEEEQTHESATVVSSKAFVYVGDVMKNMTCPFFLVVVVVISPKRVITPNVAQGITDSLLPFFDTLLFCFFFFPLGFVHPLRADWTLKFKQYASRWWIITVGNSAAGLLLSLLLHIYLPSKLCRRLEFAEHSGVWGTLFGLV